jgi:hypothetical protein
MYTPPAVCDIRCICELSGRTTGRFGSTGLRAMPSEGRHSRHSGAHPPLLPSPGNATISGDYGPDGAAGGWTSPPPPLARGPDGIKDMHSGRCWRSSAAARADSQESGSWRTGSRGRLREDCATSRGRADASSPSGGSNPIYACCDGDHLRRSPQRDIKRRRIYILLRRACERAGR